MTIENLTHPGLDPVDGDFIKITHENGMIESKHFWAAAESDPEPSFVPYEITPFQFKMRFTPEERIACRQMAKVNDEVYDLMDMLQSTLTPTLNDPMMIWGVNKLEQIGLLGPGRAAQILEIPSSQG